jgi:pimeloyl-ACP methyl ester carboxylesterase
LGLHSLSRSWARYKTIAPGARLYLFDLAGHGKTPISTQQNDVYLVAGWSDKIFDILNALEDGATAVAHIHKIVL